MNRIHVDRIVSSNVANRFFLAPTGSDSIAQAEGLGTGQEDESSAPMGRDLLWSRPVGAYVVCVDRFPRPSAWAIESNPVGATKSFTLSAAGANTGISSSINCSQPTLSRYSIAIACLIGIVFCDVASAYPVGSALSLKELVEKADFICKAVVVSSKPVDDPWFEKHVGFAAHATELKIVAIYKGPRLRNASFHHYVREDSGVVYSPQHYEFEAGRTYVVFASKTDDETMFRQIRKDHTIQRDQGVLLAADDLPHVDMTIKQVYWRELTGLLKSPKLSDVRYAIDHLDWMSGGVHPGDPKEFSRQDVLHAVHQADPSTFEQAILSLGRHFNQDPDPNLLDTDAQGSIGITVALPPPEDPVQPKPQPREIKIFSLLHGNAVEYAALLKTLFRNVGITADPRTNSIVAAGGHEELGEVEAILIRLDESESRPAAQGSAPAGPGTSTINFVPKSNPDQLSVGIAEHEEKARRLAEQIRRQSETLGPKHPDRVKNLQELDKTLSAALELKFQSEQMQLKQLEDRLSRMKMQFQFRKAASQKIVERRIQELLEGFPLDWNSGGAPTAPGSSANSGSGSNALPAKTGLSANTTQIQFVSPSGMRVLIEHDSTQLTIPDRYDFEREEKETKSYSVWLFPEGAPYESKIPAIVDVYPASARVAKFLANDSVPLQITDEELKQLRARNPVTMVIYRPKFISQKPLETITSARLDPEVDPLREAQRRGEIIAVIRFLGDPEGTPEEGLRKLPPLMDRIEQAKKKVQDIETIYYKDRSSAVDLQKALDALDSDRSEYATEWKACHQKFIKSLEDRLANANLVADGRNAQVEKLTERFRDGLVSEESLKPLVEAARRAKAEVSQIMQSSTKSRTELDRLKPRNLMQDGSIPNRNPFSFARVQKGSASTDPAENAVIWLEATIEVKFDLIRFDGLKIWFPAALRVRETTDQFQAGDLIVVLNGHLFETLDEAVAVFKAAGSGHNCLVLRGGLSGEQELFRLRNQQWDIKYLEPGPVNQVSLEVRARRNGTNETETRYFGGTCVSLDGLFVVPFSAKSLIPGESIVVFNLKDATARVVAADEKHQLTLLQLDCPNERLFRWLKCRPSLPTSEQRLTLFRKSMNSSNSSSGVRVAEVGAQVHKSITIPDAFTVNTQTGEPDQLSGSALITVTGELLGIVVGEWQQPVDAASAATAAPPPERRLIAIPAVYVEKLIRDYRNSAKPQVGEGAASQEAPHL